MIQLYQLVQLERPMLSSVRKMFEELGEPEQVLTAESPRPLVVHRLMGQLTLVADGTGRVSFDGDEFAVKPGDLAILSPKCPHAFQADQELVLWHWHWPQALLATDRVVLRGHYEFGDG